ncbi:MAG: hypothetical protein ABI074_09600 [Nakamurella sp.]
MAHVDAVRTIPVHADNFGVCGARMAWLQLDRNGIAVARRTVERLDDRDGA